MREWREGAGLVMAALGATSAAAPLADAERAVDAGAEILDLGWLPDVPPRSEPAERTRLLIRELRRRFPKVGLCVRADRPAVATAALRAGADLLDLGSVGFDPALARLAARHGAGLVCPADRRPGAELAGFARRAVELGVDQRRVAIALGPVPAGGGALAARLGALVSTGWPTLVSVDRCLRPELGGPAERRAAGLVAAAAVCATAGARVHRTSAIAEVGQVWQAVRMVAAIRGDMPPAAVRRALA